MAKRKATASWRKGSRFGSWVLTKLLDRGGNGEVWEVRGDDGTYRAITEVRASG